MKSSPTIQQARPGLPGTAAPANSSHDHPNVMPPPKPLRRILTGLAAALTLAGAAHATLIIGEEQKQPNTNDPTPIGVVSGDLLETSVASVTGEPAKISGGVGSGVRNGSYNDYSGFYINNTTTYVLDITSKPAGYDIKEIRLFSGWGTRATQAYDINYSLVGDPGTFLLLGTYTGTLPPSSDNTLMTRTYDSSAGAVPDSGVPILTGVAAIQFVIRANGNATLYHEWDVTGSATGAGTHTLHYDGNGSDSGDVPADPNSPYADFAAVTVMGSGTLAKTGYLFSGWNTAASGTGTSYNPAATFHIIADTTLYAQWTVCNLTYDGNGSDSGTAPVDPNSPYVRGTTVTVMGLGTLTKTGYFFTGWNTAANGTGTSYQPAATFVIIADTTLYAQWIKEIPGLVFGEEQYQSNGAAPSPIGVVSADLLETSVASATGEMGTISGTPGPALRDGTFNSFVGYSNGYTTTYALDITSHPAGYDINEIRLFSNGGSRTTQAYSIKYSLVGAPGTFLDMGTYTGTLRPSGEGTLMTRTYKSGGGALLTGVAAIQFVIRANGNGTLYRECDVTGSATSVASSPYDTWKTGTFANAFTDTDPTHDPDGDGMTNQQEFAFGLDPTTGASANPVTPLIGTHFTYTRYAASNLGYTVEFSTDLAGWDPAITTELIGDPDANGVQTVTVTVSDTPVDGKLFVRVRAE